MYYSKHLHILRIYTFNRGNNNYLSLKYILLTLLVSFIRADGIFLSVFKVKNDEKFELSHGDIFYSDGMYPLSRGKTEDNLV